jgi:hypothetical protein
VTPTTAMAFPRGARKATRIGLAGCGIAMSAEI